MSTIPVLETEQRYSTQTNKITYSAGTPLPLLAVLFPVGFLRLRQKATKMAALPFYFYFQIWYKSLGWLLALHASCCIFKFMNDIMLMLTWEKEKRKKRTPFPIFKGKNQLIWLVDIIGQWKLYGEIFIWLINSGPKDMFWLKNFVLHWPDGSPFLHNFKLQKRSQR